MVWLFKKTPVFHSHVSGEITIKKRYGRLAVVTGDITQSGGEIYPMWKKVVEEVSKERKDIKKCLVLGVGGGTVIELLMKRYPTMSLTGIEIDPVMLEIATKYFVLKERRDVHLLQEDAVSYITRLKADHMYDLIVVDLYIGKLNPDATRQEEFLLQIKRLLAPESIVLYNAHFQDEEEHQRLLELFHKHFTHFREVYSYPLNRVIELYSDEVVKLPGRQA